MSKATERALHEAIAAHLAALREDQEEEEERNPGILTAWVVMTEVLTGSHSEDGGQIYRTGYISPDISPSQAIGVARMGSRILEYDMSPV